jgi:hypothetical protein
VLRCQKLILPDSLVEFCIFEIYCRHSLSWQLQMAFEFDAVLIKFQGLRYATDSFITISEGIESHCVAGLSEVDRLCPFYSVIDLVLMQTKRHSGHSTKTAIRIFKEVELEFFICLVKLDVAEQFKNFVEIIGKAMVLIFVYLQDIQPMPYKIGSINSDGSAKL